MIAKKIILIILFLLFMCNFVYAETDGVDFDVDTVCKEEQQERAGYSHFVTEESQILSSSAFSEHDNQIITRQCLMRLAEENNNVAYCGIIDNSELIDSCYRALGVTYYPVFLKRILLIISTITAITLGVGFILPNKSYQYLLYVFSSLAILSEILCVSQKGYGILFMSAHSLVSYNVLLSFFVFFPLVTLVIAFIFKNKISLMLKEKSLISTILFALIIAINMFSFFIILLLAILPET